jgi:signal transduction histidine kinase
VALGRHGVVDPTAPDRLPARVADAGSGRPGAAAPEESADLEFAIESGSTTFGVLRLIGGSNGSRPRPDPLVEVVVHVAADALERGRLQTLRRAADAAAAGAVGRVTILARLATQLVGGTSIEEVARTLVDLAVDDFAAGYALFHVPDSASTVFMLVHARGYPAGLLAGEQTVAAATELPVTRAALVRTIVDIVGEDGWRSAFPTASNVPAITGVRAITAIPMQVGGVLRGVLTIGWRTTADRGRADSDLLATASAQGAQALERALLHAHDEDARRFQEAFIGVVSHELRTPITTILAGSRLLRRRLSGDPQAAELSDDIVIEADRLSRIVDDLLVLSRLERRHLTVGDEPVHLDHLLRRIVRSESARWPEHRIVVSPSTGSHVVIGDETYVEQVLRNLVSNAAKYSPIGSLVEIAIDDAPDGDVHVRVLDEGPGVAPAEVDELFSLFYRSPTTAATAAGAGIGLFVSKRLVAEMGGRMWAEPRPNGGSEFGFSLSCYPIDENELDGAIPGQTVGGGG